MDVFDKDGEAVEGVFSQEELDAKLKEAADAAEETSKAAVEAAGTAAVEQYKTDNPAPAEKTDEEKAAEAAAAGKEEEIPAWAKAMGDRIDQLNGNQNQGHLDGVTKMLDVDKANDVKTRFDAMTGYDETPDGQTRRAEDAYLLETGEKFDAGGVDVNNLAAGGTGQAKVKAGDYSSDGDKAMNKMLGNSDADVEKYGDKK